MSLRASEIIFDEDGRRIRHRGVAGAEFRLLGALWRDGGAGSLRRPPTLIGSSWRDTAGTIFWGWPDNDGGTILRPSPEGGWRTCLLPPALSLALSMRRRGTDLGSHALVLGEGLPARLALAVATVLGCRPALWSESLETGIPADRKAEIIIETTGDGGHVDRAIACCRDWGVVHAMSGGLADGPHDYYQHIHRRALTVSRVPDRPAILPGEDEVVDRGARSLLTALEGIALDMSETTPIVVQPGDHPAHLTKVGGGWSVLELG